MSDIERLIEFLKPLMPGPVKDQPNQDPSKTGTVLERLLFECWYEFEGSNQEKMDGYKILHRLEEPFWEPPVLRFRMERHGATVGGSIWADIQEWKLNIETKEANYETVGRRQVSPMDKRLDVKPIAREVAQLIVKGKIDKRLKWNKNGSVTVWIREIIPETVKQTTIGRRGRFWVALTKCLADKGWQENRTNNYKNNEIKEGSDSYKLRLYKQEVRELETKVKKLETTIKELERLREMDREHYKQYLPDGFDE